MRKLPFVIGTIILTLIFAVVGGCKLLQNSKPKIYSNSLKTPDEVVKAFCDLDAAGIRLSSLTWSEMLPYISWREEAMENVAIVISRYKISSSKKTDKAAEILVEYAIIGKYWPEKLTPAKTIEKVPFSVIKTDAGWKINSPDTMVPHVYAESLIKQLESVKKRENKPDTIKEIQDRIQMVKTLIESTK